MLHTPFHYIVEVDMDIAIIGFSFNLPGAINIEQLSSLLASGKDALMYLADTKTDSKNWINRAGYITGDDEFDYSLFGISLRDSIIIEPQQRLFIQQVWKALEFSGYNPKAIPQTVGVFSSSSDSKFSDYLKSSDIDLSRYDPFELEIGENKEQQSLRTAFLFNFTGPAMGIQSACSSGLLTVHVAMQALRNGDCEIAVAGGSSLPYPPHQGYHYRPGMNLSESGKISSFDQHADGMVPGFGAVVFVLKPLELAIKNNDRIYARIRGSAVNNDGHHKSTYTAPSTTAIAKNLIHALENSNVNKQDICFIEAHGSGTLIGDVLEATALKMVFSANEHQEPIALSSVKAAVGHLDAAAGHAGLLKSTLQIWQKCLYPAANFNTLNSSISLENSPLFIPNLVIKKSNLIGVVNSLGIGGTNCALVIDNAQAVLESSLPQFEQLPIYVGAESLPRLEKLLQQLQEELAETEWEFRDIIYTLTRRACGKKYIIQFNATRTEQLIRLMAQANTQQVLTDTLNINLSEYSGKAIALSSSELDPERKVALSVSKSLSPVLSEQSHVCSILRNIWIDNLMVPKISEDDSFIDLGGHSILVLSMLEDIQNALRITLSLAWFDRFYTFSKQVTELERLIGKPTSPMTIIPLRQAPQPPRCRLVLVHASISGAERYQQLANLLADDIDVIAIDSYNLYSAEKIYQLDNLAEFYAEKLIEATRDKSIPHLIGGWSLGGMLARAITAKVATRLNVCGNILLDSVLYSPEYDLVFSEENLHYFMDVNNFTSENAKEAKSIKTLHALLKIESVMVKEFRDENLSLPVLNIIATGVKKVIEQPELQSQFLMLKRNNGWNLNGHVSKQYIDTDHEGVVNISQACVVANMINRFILEHV